jgi:hypothetical protein
MANTIALKAVLTGIKLRKAVVIQAVAVVK